MVRASPSDLGTIRAAGSLGSSAGTMIEHGGTMESQMGTMVINTDDEDEDAGTMKSKCIRFPETLPLSLYLMSESIKCCTFNVNWDHDILYLGSSDRYIWIYILLIFLQ